MRSPTPPVLAALLLAACVSSPPPSPGARLEGAPAVAPPPVAATPEEAAAAPAHATSEPTRLTPAQAARDAAIAPAAAAFLGAFSNVQAHVTQSGAVVFLSDRDGLPQIYVTDAKEPSAPARRLPTPNERVVDTVLTPDERTVLFTSDVGSDGSFHVFRVGVDGSGLRDLTAGESLHRDRPVVARGKNGLFGYSAHAPSSEATRVFLQSAAGGAAREIYADARGGSLEDLAHDGAHALFTRFNSDEDTVVLDIETATGRATRLFPPEGHPAKASGVYSASGDRVYVSAEVLGRPPEVIALDRKSGKTLARYEEQLLPHGGISDIAVSPSGDRVAIAVDGGNHSEIRLLDARSLRIERTLEIPPGATTLGSFTKDGARLTLTESRPDAPRDIFLVDAATGGVRALRSEARPGLPAAAPMSASIASVRAFDGLTISTNVYLPSPVTAKLPTLVVIHGGPSSSAYVRWNPATRFFSSLGYAIVEPNIRGSNGFGVAFQEADNKEKRGDALRDVETINAWARAQAWCDPDRIVIMGTSYGGYMTLLALGRQPRLWRAGVDVSGMSDLRTMEKLEDQAIRVYDETEFGVLGREDDLLFAWSPLKTVDAIVAPVFIYQGARDPITPQNEADQIVKALRERGVPVEYMLLSNEGHGVVRRENNTVYLARVARFLEENAAPR